MVRIGGDEGNHSSFATTTVDRDGPFRSAIGSKTALQRYLHVTANGNVDAGTIKALQKHVGAQHRPFLSRS